MNDSALRQEIIQLLRGEQAHSGVDRILSGIRPENRHKRIHETCPSAWELLEHVRIAQEDILKYMLDPDWKSPEWPDGYWPPSETAPTESEWDGCLSRFQWDLESAIALCGNSRITLTDPIPHAQKHTYLRELLLIADHNTYHLGQVVQIRKALGDWSA